MRKLIWAAMLATITVPTIPASAYGASPKHQHDQGDHNGKNGDKGRKGHWKDYQHDRGYNRNVERRNYRQNNRQLTPLAWQNYNRYDYNRPDPRYGTYYADRYYRDGSNYQPYTLAQNDRIYRGSNGRYYCRRNDGTTGLIIGAVGGGLLGNVIAPRGSKTLGAILGGTAGALLGRTIGRDGVRCQ